ncbi:MAG TPA: archaemetzincin [Candidatus Eisenbacteria bacterium]|nr:archaemetzincin [Candidatus Eisenbacteria bacterium]
MLAFVTGCAAPRTPAERLRHERLPRPFESMKAIAKPLGPPGPNDWLASHPEPGQSLAAFLAAPRIRIAPPHDTIDVVFIGEPGRARQRIVALTADYLGRFFGTSVRLRPAVQESDLPDSAFRSRPDLGGRQLSSRWVLEWLAARRDTQVFATIALSAFDLYPAPTWNFVFGQASPAARAGVWSVFRFGNPDESLAAERLCLQRTMVTATHEIAHLLPISHCIAYECLMNGSNHLEELDQRPLYLCPPCLAKLMACSAADPVERARRLAEFHVMHGFPGAEAVNRGIAEAFMHLRGSEVPK